MRNQIVSKKEKNPSLIKRNWYQRLFSITSFMILLFTVFSGGCKKVVEEPGLIGICPVVVSTDPAAGAINITTNKKISATFNEAMNPSSINTSTFLLYQGTNQVLGTVTYTGMTATFTPSNPLAGNTVYTATITTAAKDPAKTSMVANYVWNFNTGTTPVVVSTDPPNGAVEVPLNKIISATFSAAMDQSSILGASTFV